MHTLNSYFIFLIGTTVWKCTLVYIFTCIRGAHLFTVLHQHDSISIYLYIYIFSCLQFMLILRPCVYLIPQYIRNAKARFSLLQPIFKSFVYTLYSSSKGVGCEIGLYNQDTSSYPYKLLSNTTFLNNFSLYNFLHMNHKGNCLYLIVGGCMSYLFYY